MRLVEDKQLTQADAVYIAMKELGGLATFHQLNQRVFMVRGVTWNTKTPFASVRRIVQQDKRFFKLRPGLWALTEYRDQISTDFELSPTQPELPVDAFDHSYYQGLLVELGNFKKFDTFVPNQDKNRRFLQQQLKDISTLSEFPEFTYDRVLRRAKTIDVTWFNTRGFPFAFYEVEHSTDIYNSLLKFVELQDFRTRFFIVADAIRQSEYQDKLRQQAFTEIQNRVTFLTYERLARQHSDMDQAIKSDFLL